MNWIVKSVIGFTAAVFLGLAGLIFYINVFDGDTEAQKTRESVPDFTEAYFEEVQPNQSVELSQKISVDMSEYEMLLVVHAMSHQKVQADEKWELMELTPERVNALLEIVETNRSEYPSHKMLNEILTKWSNGNFTEADKDHNVVWNYLNGDTGKATGLLSAEEEKEFVQKNFR